MAVFQTEAPLSNGGFISFEPIRQLLVAFEIRAEDRRTQLELLNLNDRELSDIGLSREDVLNGNFKSRR